MPARQSISSLRFILASRKVDSACFHEATPTFRFRSDCEGRLGIDAETLKGASRRGFRFCDPSPSSDSSGGAGPFRIQLYMSSVEGSASLEFSCLVVQPCEETKGRAAHRSGAGSEVHSGVSSRKTTMAPTRVPFEPMKRLNCSVTGTGLPKFTGTGKSVFWWRFSAMDSQVKSSPAFDQLPVIGCLML